MHASLSLPGKPCAPDCTPRNENLLRNCLAAADEMYDLCDAACDARFELKLTRRSVARVHRVLNRYVPAVDLQATLVATLATDHAFRVAVSLLPFWKRSRTGIAPQRCVVQRC